MNNKPDSSLFSITSRRVIFIISIVIVAICVTIILGALEAAVSTDNARSGAPETFKDLSANYDISFVGCLDSIKFYILKNVETGDILPATTLVTSCE